MTRPEARSARREILSWDRPILTRAVEWLARGWEGSGPLDLASTLLVVPTRQSGRRLRSALAAHASMRRQAVLPPRVMLPEELVGLATPATAKVAGRTEALIAWVRVLQGTNLEQVRAVFPVDPARRDFVTMFPLAEQFVRVQELLAENGLRFADVAMRAGAGFPEVERWDQLGALEAAFDGALSGLGLAAPGAVARAAGRAPEPPPEGIRRVVVLAVTDLRPTAIGILERWAAGAEIVVLAFGAEGDDAAFDAWGRPPVDRWSGRPLGLPRFEERVHVMADATAEAAEVSRWVRAYSARPGMVALGCADAEVEPLLAVEMKAAGLEPFRPEGEPLGQHALAGLLELLARAAREEGWEAWSMLARRAEILDWLGREVPSIPGSRFLAGLDTLHDRHLPPTIAEALRLAGGESMRGPCPDLAEALSRLDELVAPLRTGEFPGAWNAALAAIFRGCVVDPSTAAGRAFLDAASAWRESAAEAQAAGPDLSTGEAAWLALRLFAGRKRYGDKPAAAVEIDGWLELLFRDEPHLLLAGCNDGALPEAVLGHGFLPDALREKLGLRTNAQRLARDAWQLAALAACRPGPGRLDLWLARTSPVGDPLRPSRLLFLCPDAELPARVGQLFRDVAAGDANLAWRRAWQLRPPAAPAVRRISVTGFRSYLACPFRFHLRHTLGMQAVDPDKRELDAGDFGDLLHRVLERLGRDPDWRDSVDERQLAAWFGAELDRQVALRHGRERSLPLLVQVESARQRLARAAQLQAAERAAGWVIQEVEWRFPHDRLVLGGLAVSGTIDRVERNESTGAWRVLDYKTAETPVAPPDAHLRALRRAEGPGHVPEAAWEPGGRPKAWADLQLPLYRWAVREALGAEDAGIGYFNLPKAVTEAAVTPWEDYDATLHAAALRCAGAVAVAVAAGRFWPPAESVPNDEFAGLFHGGTAESVAWR